jgi:HipA-like protein
MPRGSNKEAVCFQNRIDENDAFGLLLITAANDTIGAVTVENIENDKK